MKYFLPFLLLPLLLSAPAQAAPPGGFGEPRILARTANADTTGLSGAVRTGDGLTVVYHDGSDLYAVVNGTRTKIAGGLPKRAFGGRAGGETLVAGADGTRLAVVDLGYSHTRANERRLSTLVAPPGQPFGAIQALTDQAGSTIEAAVAHDGTAIVAWLTGAPSQTAATMRLHVAVRRPGGTFGPAQVVAGPARQIDLTALAGGPAGLAVLAFRSYDGTRFTPQVAELPAGASAFAAPAATPSEFDVSDIAFLPGGSALLAGREPTEKLALMRRSPAGAYAAEAVTGFVSSGRVAVSPDGGALLIGRTADGFYTSDAAPGGPFGGPVLLAHDVEAPVPFRYSGGAAVVYDLDGFGDVDRVFSSLYDRTAPGGSFAHSGAVARDVAPVPVPGEQPGELTLVAGHGRAIYAMSRPAGDDTRRPLVTRTRAVRRVLSRRDRRVDVSLRVDEAADLSIRATLSERGRRTRSLAARLRTPEEGSPVPPFSRFAYRVTLPRCRAGERSRLSVTVTARDSAGNRTRYTLRRNRRC